MYDATHHGSNFMPRRSIVNRQRANFRSCATFFGCVLKKCVFVTRRLPAAHRRDRPSPIASWPEFGADSVAARFGDRGACPLAGSSRSRPASGPSAAACRGPARPIPIRRNGPAIDVALQHRQGGAVEPVGHPGRVRQGLAAGQEPVVGALQLQRHDRRRRCRAPWRGRRPAPQSDQRCQRSRSGSAVSSAKVVSWEIDFSALVGGDRPGVLAAGESPQPVAEAPKRRISALRSRPRRSAMVRMPSRSSAAAAACADAPDHARPACGRGRPRSRPRPITRKPRGLSRSEAILARNLLWRQADRDGEPELGLDPRLQPGQQDGGRGAVQALGAGEVEEGLVERQRFDQRGQLQHHRADRAADLDVARPCAGGSPRPRGRASAPGTSAWPSARP